MVEGHPLHAWAPSEFGEMVANDLNIHYGLAKVILNLNRLDMFQRHLQS